MPYTFDNSAILDELIGRFQSTRLPISVDFRELAPWIRKGDQFTHQIHPYPAKLIPHIASFFIGCPSLSKEGDAVLDPFCGTGTVALEASLAGRDPWGADANPLALLIARVKTYPYSVSSLRKVVQNVLSEARNLNDAEQISVVNVEHWYSPHVRQSLERIGAAIKNVTNRKQQDFFLVCLSVVSRRVSFADPRISVPVKLKIKEQFSVATSTSITEKLLWLEKVDVYSEFERCCMQNIERIDQTNKTMPARKEISLAGVDARNLLNIKTCGIKKPISNFPLVITSPPYGSAQKYIRATSLGLNWTALANPEQLRTLENSSIGREHLRGEPCNTVLPKTQEDFLRSVNKINPLRAQLARTYLSELKDAITEIGRVTAPRGHIVLVIGNNEVSGHSMRNDQFCEDVLRNQGFHQKLHLLDHIQSRGLMTKRNKTASMITRESVLVFQKD